MKLNTGIPIFNTPVDPQGTENQPPNAIFHTGSKSLMSHIIDVSETAIIVKAYGFLDDASTITVCTVTTERDGLNYGSPMVLNGRTVQLSKRNNVLVIDMTGKYSFLLSDGLGVTTCAYHESGLGLWSFGLNAYAVANGMLEFIETETVRPDVTENQVREYVKLSADSGQLLQIHHDGLYYGILPPIAFIDQYVSSSTGSDSDFYSDSPPGTNTGTRAKPWKTIQKAIEHLPDGTQGNIWLYAGDTFNTVPTAYTPPNPANSIDIVSYTDPNALYGQSQTLNIGNRSISFYPYNDPAIDAIDVYNNTHNTSYNPYLVAEINFPIISVTLAVNATAPNYYYPMGFGIGVNGTLNFNGIKLRTGQVIAANPQFNSGSILGSGQLIYSGGHVLLSNVPFLGQLSGGLSMNVTLYGVEIHDNIAPATPQLFAALGTRFVTNTIYTAIPPGGLAFPGTGMPYTSNGDNVATYLTPKSMWWGIKVKQAPSAAVVGPPAIPQLAGVYYNLITDIKITGPVDP